MTEYTIHLRPEGCGAPPELRLRKLLKVALRQCGLRAVEVKEMPTLEAKSPVVQAEQPRQGGLKTLKDCAELCGSGARP